jgi:hypothetical protein
MPKLVRTKTGNLLGSPWKFGKHGECGTEVSELFPQVAKHVDDLCVIRSMVADNINHNGACLQMNTGEQAFSRPSLGSWLLYGLGSENRDLPGFVVLSPSQPAQGAPLWSSSFLPAAFQGTLVSDLKNPVANLPAPGTDVAGQRRQLDALKQLNELHRVGRDDDSRLSARIAAFELAFRMQREAPEAFSVAGETDATKKLYGLDAKETEIFGTQCLLARRLVERGVRVVELYDADWDHHNNLTTRLPAKCKQVDRGMAALVTDLKRRGLLEDTLVIWGAEFGRTPLRQTINAGGAATTAGRDHHKDAFTVWLAGGGMKRGYAHGRTDEFGFNVAENPVHVHDLNATVLHLLGLDHERLTYRFQGREFRLTDVHGHVVRDLIA